MTSAKPGARQTERQSDHLNAKSRALLSSLPMDMRVTFLSSFIWCLLIHGYVATNKITNIDDINQVLGVGYGAASGRWLLPYAAKLDGSFSMPWLIGILSFFLLSLSACMIVRLLRIDRPVLCVIAGGLVVSFPTVASTLMYMFTADCYFLSLFMACAAVCLTVRYKKGFLPGIVLLVLSMGIYQSYVCTAVALFAAVLLLDALSDRPFSSLFRDLLKYAATLLVAVGIYMYIARSCMPKEGLTNYMGISSMGKISLATLPGLIKTAYLEYNRFFIKDMFNVHFGFLAWAYGLSFIASLYLLIRIIKAQKLRLGRIILVFLIAALYPLAADFIFIMVPNQTIHLLMVYGLNFILLGPLALVNMSAEKAPEQTNLQVLSQGIVLLTLAVTIFSYAIASNQAYFSSQLVQNRACAWSGRLLSAIQASDEWTPETPVILLGKYSEPADSSLDALAAVQLTGSQTSVEDIVNTYSYVDFLKYVMGWDYKTVMYVSRSAKADAYTSLPEVQEMPRYPQSGSIKLINGKLIVKLGETD